MSRDAFRKTDEQKRIEAIDAKLLEAEEDNTPRREYEAPAWPSLDYMEFRAYLAEHTDHYA
jgi:hypothetical protein